MVDWKDFSEKENYREGTYSQELYHNMVDKLIKKGVLSTNPKNNFSIETPGFCLSPRYVACDVILFFTKKEDAKKYAKINYSNALYPVYVEKNT